MHVFGLWETGYPKKTNEARGRRVTSRKKGTSTNSDLGHSCCVATVLGTKLECSPCSVLKKKNLRCLCEIRQKEWFTPWCFNKITMAGWSAVKGGLFWEWRKPPLTYVVLCRDSSACPLASCRLFCARRALHTSPVKPELCLQPPALPCPLGYFYSSRGYFC